MARKKNETSKNDQDQNLIDERINAVAEKFGAEDVELEGGDDVETVIILKDSEGNELRRGTLSELEEADDSQDPQGDEAQYGVLEQTLADLKTKYGAETVEVDENANGTDQSVIILKDKDGNIIDQGIASELLNKIIVDESLVEEDGSPKTLTLDEVHEQGIGTAVPGANPSAAKPKVVDVNDLPKAHSAK